MGKKRTKRDTGSWSGPEQELPATPRSGPNTSALCRAVVGSVPAATIMDSIPMHQLDPGGCAHTSKPFSQPLFCKVGLKGLPIPQMTEMEAQRVPVTCPRSQLGCGRGSMQTEPQGHNSLSCLLCPSPTPEVLMEDEEPSGPACRGRPRRPLPESAFPSPGPWPGLVGAPGGQTASSTHPVCPEWP